MTDAGTGLVIREVRQGEADPAGIAAFAARTFPDACPPWLPTEHVRSFIEQGLSAGQFAEWLNDESSRVFVAEIDGIVRGYAVSLHGKHVEAPADWADEQSAYLSKLYVDPEVRGGGIAARLIALAIDAARADGCAGLWLGVNDENVRARSFYRKSGLSIRGKREFEVGGTRCTDDVFGVDLRASA